MLTKGDILYRYGIFLLIFIFCMNTCLFGMDFQTQDLSPQLRTASGIDPDIEEAFALSWGARHVVTAIADFYISNDGRTSGLKEFLSQKFANAVDYLDNIYIDLRQVRFENGEVSFPFFLENVRGLATVRENKEEDYPKYIIDVTEDESIRQAKRIEGLMDMAEYIRKVKGGVNLKDQVFTPDAAGDMAGYVSYEAVRLVVSGRQEEAIKLIFGSGAYLGRIEDLSVLENVLNGLIEAYKKDASSIENIRKFSNELRKTAVNVSEPPKDLVEISGAVQLMTGQTDTIISWIARGVPNAHEFSVSANADRMASNDKRGQSFLVSPSGVGIDEVPGEGEAGFYWRGIEKLKKLGHNVMDAAKVNVPLYQEAEGRVVQYLMDHGFLPVRGGLKEITEDGTLSTIHETAFLNDVLPGSMQTTSTGAGHFQGLKLDIKNVTEGRGVQVNVKYNDKNEIIEVIAQEVKAGDWCLALPGYVDYMINLGGLRFNDMSVELSPSQAAMFNDMFDTYDKKAFEKYTENLKPEFAPYIGMQTKDGQLIVEAVANVPNYTWIGGFDTFSASADGQAGLVKLYESISNPDLDYVTTLGKLNAVVGSLWSEFGQLKNSGRTYERHSTSNVEGELPVVSYTELDRAKPEAPEKVQPAVFDNIAGISAYVNSNMDFFKKTLISEDEMVKVIRVPVEIVTAPEVKTLLAAIQSTPNARVELFSIESPRDIDDVQYGKYGIEKKDLPKDFVKDRANTITILPVNKDEVLTTAGKKSTRDWGIGDISPESSILSPVGINYDRAGLIRSIIMGLRLSEIAANENYDKNNSFVVETMKEYRDLCFEMGQPVGQFDLTASDLINIARGDIKVIVRSLNKLIKLLPITPIDTEQLRRMYQNVKKSLIAA
ncbi:MAG: hypothetical protein P9L88_02855 [Candidatus Tantalella remota]|nr:hypothetical protein [Candidatus Tantalella remota]